MNSYEIRQAERRARYEERAEKAEAEAKRRFEAGSLREEVSGIPLGQPILVGHHSERRHRAALKRSENHMRAGIAASEKAEHYRAKADGVGKGGVSSDDPDAADKVRARLARREALQVTMREANKVIRAFYKKGVRDAESGELWTRYLEKLRAIDPAFSESAARKALEPDLAGRIGFADYQLTNNSAEIRRLKQRLAKLEKLEAVREAQDGEAVVRQVGAVRIEEDAEENRLRLFFPGKPSAEIRNELKRAGFRWARSVGAWQRQISNAARLHAERIAKGIEE